jgi:hypothetical protein
MKYFVAEGPDGDGRCSDPACPCDDTIIARGDGYMIVSPEVVQWRFDCLFRSDEQIKAKRLEEYTNRTLQLRLLRQMPVPILACERAARARGVDLAVARADAAHWWKTNEVPLRVTPMQDGTLMGMSRDSEMILELMQKAYRSRMHAEDDRPGSNVFVSYSRFDFERVLEIDDWLRSHGYRTWFDIKHLDHHLLWDEAIENAIVNAQAVLACISIRSRAHRGYVHHEWQRATELCGKRVIPMLLDDIAPPEVLRKADEPYRWFEEAARERVLARLASLPPIERSRTVAEVKTKIAPKEYHAFRTKLLETVRASAARRARGHFESAMKLFEDFGDHPLFTLRPHMVRGIASTAAIVHAAKIEYLLATLGRGSVPQPIIAELLRDILEAPVWSEGGTDPDFGTSEARMLNRHYLHALTAVDRETNLFRTPESLSEVAGVIPQESPFVYELFRRRIAELAESVGPHQPSFANVFDIEPTLALVPAQLVDQARTLIADGNVLIEFPVEPNDPDATLETWQEKWKDGSLRSFCAVIPSERAWARALLVDPVLFFEDKARLSAFRKLQKANGDDIDSIGYEIGKSTVQGIESAYEGDEELEHPYQEIKALFSESESVTELIDCLCTRIGADPGVPRTAALLHPPFFVLVTANSGTKEELRSAIEPYSYQRWLTLLRIQNPHLFKAKKNGVQYQALVHFVLSIEDDCLDPGLAILDLPPLGIHFRELHPSEMMGE